MPSFFGSDVRPTPKPVKRLRYPIQVYNPDVLGPPTADQLANLDALNTRMSETSPELQAEGISQPQTILPPIPESPEYQAAIRAQGLTSTNPYNLRGADPTTGIPTGATPTPQSPGILAIPSSTAAPILPPVSSQDILQNLGYAEEPPWYASTPAQRRYTQASGIANTLAANEILRARNEENARANAPTYEAIAQTYPDLDVPLNLRGQQQAGPTLPGQGPLPIVSERADITSPFYKKYAARQQQEVNAPTPAQQQLEKDKLKISQQAANTQVDLAISQIEKERAEIEGLTNTEARAQAKFQHEEIGRRLIDYYTKKSFANPNIPLGQLFESPVDEARVFTALKDPRYLEERFKAMEAGANSKDAQLALQDVRQSFDQIGKLLNYFGNKKDRLDEKSEQLLIQHLFKLKRLSAQIEDRWLGGLAGGTISLTDEQRTQRDDDINAQEKVIMDALNAADKK